jgi:hypothetical protein
MARLLAAFRRSPADASPTAAPPRRAVRRAAPPPGELRRERRGLLRAREERIRDLGGVVLEMYRQDSFRETLLDELCAEIVAIEERLRELDLMLEARRPPAARCECGAPIFWGARYCPSCGRAVAVPAHPGASEA